MIERNAIPADTLVPSVMLTIVGFELSPQAVTDALQLEPTTTDISLVRNCQKNRKEECGSWSYHSARHLSSPDLLEHIEHLLAVFTPLKARLEEFSPPSNIILQVWCGKYARLEPRHVAGIAALGARLQIYLTAP